MRKGSRLAQDFEQASTDGHGWQGMARVALSLILFGLAAYIIWNYIRALVWAVVICVAIWPLYERVRQAVAVRLRNEVMPLLATALVAAVFLLPFAVLAIEAARELHQIVDYTRQAEQGGIPVPDVLLRLPYGAKQAGDWWNANLAHAGWLQDFLHRLDTSSNRELGRTIGADAVHRVVLFGFCLLTLFFLFKNGETVLAQGLTASNRVFGPHGERLARQMGASVHGTVNGLVLVAIGEGVLMGVVYAIARVPHPILFGALTAVAALIPFAAAIAIAFAALAAFAGAGAVAAIAIVVAGLLVTFSADHFVRPQLIGGATKLPFLWVLLGILGGVETFRLLGLFVGPAVMAAVILIWRDLSRPEGADATPASSPDRIAEPHGHP